MITPYVNSFVCDLNAYEPGKPIEETARELGLEPDAIVKLASNENPLGPSPLAQKAIIESATTAHFYPDGGGYKLRSAIAEKFHLSIENTVLGNGSNEIIELLCHTFLHPGAELIAAEHAFVVYKLMAKLFGATYIEVPDPSFIHDLEAMADAITEKTRLLFIANPNNPTGTIVSEAEIDTFMAKVPPHVVIVFDEAYFEFLKIPPNTLKYIQEGRNVCILRTFSKAQGLAALRIGYGLTTPELATLLNKARQPFNVNSIAQAAALAALHDHKHIEATVFNNAAELRRIQKALQDRNIEYVPSVANFILMNVGDGDAIFQSMLQRGVIVRAMRSYKLPEWIRVSIGTQKQNDTFLRTLDQLL